jgi:hypothetical protein
MMAWPTRLRGAVAVVALASGTTLAAELPKPPAVAPEEAARPLAAIALANPGFESTRPGKLGAPDGWWAVQHAGPESYTFTVDTEVRRSGQRSLRMENVGPEPFGTIYQSIDATPYRGKTLRFAAWIRTDGAQGNRFGTGAGLHLQSSRSGFPRDTAPMRRNAVSGTTAWTRYELVLAVADDVDRVEIGLNLFGPGIAWLDDATLDVIEPPARPAAAPKA